jgi:DNA polymerase IV
MQRVVMHVDLDAFYASVEQLRRPELRGKPVIVGGAGVEGERGVVAAASYEARPFGVRSAMPLGRAKRLCPTAVFVPCDFPAYREASRSVFAILDHYSPAIEPIALDEAYLDLTGEQALLGEPQAVAHRLRDEVKAGCGLDLSIGVASCKLVAKVASELRKPKGLVVVRPGEEAQFLSQLPLAKLPGCGPATVSRLERLGARTIGDVAALPDPLLGELFGQYGRMLGAHARGIDPSPVQPPGDPKSISREVTFDRDQTDTAWVRETALALLQDVGQSLRAHGLSARTVVLKIRYQPFETQSRQATLPYPTDRDDQLARALRELLETQLHPSRPIRLIGAGVSNLESGATQLDLLETRSSRLAMLDEQLDQLRGRYGDHVIARGATARPHQKDVRRDDLDAVR